MVHVRINTQMTEATIRKAAYLTTQGLSNVPRGHFSQGFCIISMVADECEVGYSQGSMFPEMSL